MKIKKQIRLLSEDENFNNRHPELRKNSEIFLLNIRLQEFENFKKSAAQPFPFKKIRMGKTAYNNLGEKVKGFVPLFGIKK